MTDELPFVDVLRRLAEAEPVQLPLIYRLSELSQEEF